MDRFQIAIRGIVDSFTRSYDLQSWARQYNLEDDEYVIARLFQLICIEIENSETVSGPLTEDQTNDFNELVTLCDSVGDVTSHQTYCERRSTDEFNATSLNIHSTHTATNAATDDETTAPRPKRQRTINQYGGLGGAVPDIADTSTNDIPPYVITKRNVKYIKKSGAKDISYDIKFNESWNGETLRNLHQNLQDLFEDVLGEATSNLQPNDLGRVIIHHGSLDGPIIVPLQPLAELNAEIILGHIEKVLQSHQDLSMDSSFRVNVGTIQLPTGGRSNKTITQVTGPNNSIHLKRSLIQVVNHNDNLCMSRAIVMAWAKTKRITNSEWQDLVGGPYPGTPIIDLVLQHMRCPQSYYVQLGSKTRNEQKKMALRFCELAGISSDRPCSLNDISAFEEVLQCQILVVSAVLGNKFIRVGDQDTDRPKLFLYLVETPEKHFHAIVNITGFFSASYFCQHCLKPYSNKLRHSCSMTCNVCHSQNCPETNTMLTCRHCHVTCHSLECFHRHRLVTKTKKGNVIASKCDSFWKCTTCKKTICRKDREPTDHVCGERKCICCQEFVEEDHLCYQTAKSVEDSETKLIFYDFECRQDVTLQCEEGYIAQGPCSNCPEDNCPHKSLCQHCQQSWCGKNQHMPNYLVAQSACESCKVKAVTEESQCSNCGSRCYRCNTRGKKDKSFSKPPCENSCGYRQVIFEGDGAHIQFCRWLLDSSHKNVTAMAHNNKAYDGYFLLEYMIDQSVYPSKIIYSGSKIMYMQIEKGLNIRVIDSLNFLPMKLASLPKAFGLTELKKGYFPHLMNTEDNQNYCGPFPGPDLYGVKYMCSNDRIDFLDWYAQQDGQFNFRQEMKSYCVSDVAVLREACLKFQQLMLEATGEAETVDGNTIHTGGVDPFSQYITIASVCMGTYQSKFLKQHQHVKLTDGQSVSEWMTAKENEDGSFDVKLQDKEWIRDTELVEHGLSLQEAKTVSSPIAQVPSDGYVKREQFSMVSIQWLAWLQHKNPIKYTIQHALNGGEHLVPGTNYRLDGYCSQTNTAFEFNGCLWHGCRKCFPHDRSTTIQPRTKQSIEELYALTCRKRELLKMHGYKVIEIWEHEFHHQLKSNAEMKTFVKALDLQERLEPRDSFYGGRTNACTLHYKARHGEEIHYVDFTSLYPWVNKYCQYPVGHPQIITTDFKQLDQYFGIAKVKILPPRCLYHPVLPYRSVGKLKFPLCRTCADTEQQTPCTHTDEERCILGTWCIPEILKALDMGYNILNVYEVYHWSETTQYDRETKDGGLFADYINTFLKLKQEASGWPEWCKSEDDKNKYTTQYMDKEGIQLDKHKIQKNPGLRSLAKLCLNSFWGKYGQRLNMQQSAFIHETKAELFFQMLTDPSKEVENFHILTDSILQLEYRHKTAFVPEDLKTNIFLATFTTSWARLKLYSVMEKIDRKVLYYDTDSIVYLSTRDSYQPPIGDYLGDLTDELDGDFIEEFVSAGPKNYSYRTSKGKEVCKVRGFSLNHTNKQLINFEAIRDIVLSPTRDATITVVNPSKISREKRKRKIYNRVEKKTYQLVYTKRVIQPNLDTLPYGY